MNLTEIGANWWSDLIFKGTKVSKSDRTGFTKVLTRNLDSISRIRGIRINNLYHTNKIILDSLKEVNLSDYTVPLNIVMMIQYDNVTVNREYSTDIIVGTLSFWEKRREFLLKSVNNIFNWETEEVTNLRLEKNKSDLKTCNRMIKKINKEKLLK